MLLITRFVIFIQYSMLSWCYLNIVIQLWFQTLFNTRQTFFISFLQLPSNNFNEHYLLFQNVWMQMMNQRHCHSLSVYNCHTSSEAKVTQNQYCLQIPQIILFLIQLMTTLFVKKDKFYKKKARESKMLATLKQSTQMFSASGALLIPAFLMQYWCTMMQYWCTMMQTWWFLMHSYCTLDRIFREFWGNLNGILMHFWYILDAFLMHSWSYSWCICDALIHSDCILDAYWIFVWCMLD